SGRNRYRIAPRSATRGTPSSSSATPQTLVSSNARPECRWGASHGRLSQMLEIATAERSRLGRVRRHRTLGQIGRCRVAPGLTVERPRVDGAFRGKESRSVACAVGARRRGHELVVERGVNGDPALPAFAVALQAVAGLGPPPARHASELRWLAGV